jgi:hypothetical protein
MITNLSVQLANPLELRHGFIQPEGDVDIDGTVAAFSSHEMTPLHTRCHTAVKTFVGLDQSPS